MKEQPTDIIINGGIYSREAEECYLCGAAGRVVHENLIDRLYAVGGKWNIMTCTNCDLNWINPRPLSKEVGKLYRLYHTHAKEQYPGFLHDIDRGLTCRAFNYENSQRKGAGYRIGQFLSLFGIFREWAGSRVMWLAGPPKGTLLDVGCGSGSFLKRMSDFGWDSIGLEPDREAAKIAKKATGARLITTPLEQAELPPSSFNAITMSHVLEHFADPVKAIETCGALLKRGGKLVIATPNANSLGQKIFGVNWQGYDVPRHMFIFSPDSLLACIRKAGLKPVESMTIAKSAWGTWAVSRILKKNLANTKGSGRLRPRVEGLAFWVIEYLLSRFIHCGEEIIAVAVHRDTEEIGR